MVASHSAGTTKGACFKEAQKAAQSLLEFYNKGHGEDSKDDPTMTPGVGAKKFSI